MKFTISITSSKVDRCISPVRPPRERVNINAPVAKTENNIYFLSFESLDDFPLLSWPFSKPMAYPFIAERLNNHYHICNFNKNFPRIRLPFLVSLSYITDINKNSPKSNFSCSSGCKLSIFLDLVLMCSLTTG